MNLSKVPVELQSLSFDQQGETRTDLADIQILQDGPNAEFVLTLSLEHDVFFNLRTLIGRDEFDTIRREQQLVIGYQDFPQVVGNLMTSCIQESSTHACLIVLEQTQDDTAVTLHVVRRMDHKIVELLSIPMDKVEGDMERAIVQSKFNELQSRLQESEVKLNALASMYRSGKTPALFRVGKRD